MELRDVLSSESLNIINQTRPVNQSNYQKKYFPQHAN